MSVFACGIRADKGRQSKADEKEEKERRKQEEKQKKQEVKQQQELQEQEEKQRKRELKQQKELQEKLRKKEMKHQASSLHIHSLNQSLAHSLIQLFVTASSPLPVHTLFNPLLN